MSLLLSPEEQIVLAEFTEALAYRDLFSGGGGQAICRAESVGGAVAFFMPSLPVILLNRVIGLGVREPVNSRVVAELVRRYKEAGVQKFAVQLVPQTEASLLPSLLEDAGFERRDNWTKFMRHTDTAVKVPTDLRVECVGKEYADAFAELAGDVFHMPSAVRSLMRARVGAGEWMHFLAFDGATPVSTGALFICETAAWLGLGATLPSYRGRGAQAALIAERIRVASNLGCDWVVSETEEETPERPNPSCRNIRRTGFHALYQRSNYIWTAQT